MKHYLLIFFSLLSFGCTSTPPKDNSDYKNIIGKTVKIHNLEIAQFDFPYKLNWQDAKNSCESLGSGWRLPNYDEFDLIIRYNKKIENYTEGCYWTSDSFDKEERAQVREIYGTKNHDECLDYNWKHTKHWVRAVRNF